MRYALVLSETSCPGHTLPLLAQDMPAMRTALSFQTLCRAAVPVAVLAAVRDVELEAVPDGELDLELGVEPVAGSSRCHQLVLVVDWGLPRRYWIRRLGTCLPRGWYPSNRTFCTCTAKAFGR